MFEIKGSVNTAKVFTDYLEETGFKQVLEMMNSEVSRDSSIAIMPDCNAGAGCVIGLTMTLKDRVCPNLVGVDIGCSMRVIELGNIDIDFKELDKFIHENIPNGKNVNQNILVKFDRLDDLIYQGFDKNRTMQSIGSLGGGNHFIEVNEDKDKNKYLVIHSGSRHLGLEVANHYQKLAKEQCDKFAKQPVIDRLKKENRESEISSVLSSYRPVSKGLEYLTGKGMEDYLHDIEIVQEYAVASRKSMTDRICEFLGVRNAISWETKHNYIDVENMILRKGAVDASDCVKLLIPINMRDGSLLCIGKGNKDFNYSAPHGAGRLMSRSKAKENIKLEDFEESMREVYTTCVNNSTIDESPFAYKPIDEIIKNSADTVDILKIIKPLYNFKSS